MIFNNRQMQIMQSGLNALSTQQQVILHNLANYETPNYKAKHVVFDEVLRNERGQYEVNSRVVEETGTEVRTDGNNVDADVESLKLYQNYLQTSYIYSKISSQISNYRYVLKQAPK